MKVCEILHRQKLNGSTNRIENIIKTATIHNILHVQTVQRFSIKRCISRPQIEIWNNLYRFIIHYLLNITHASYTHFPVHKCYTELLAHLRYPRQCLMTAQNVFLKNGLIMNWPQPVQHVPHHQNTSSTWILNNIICMSEMPVKTLLSPQGIMSSCFVY